jgi:hypothetical protein
MKQPKYIVFFVLTVIMITGAILSSSCIKQWAESSKAGVYTEADFTPPENWEKIPQTYGWSGGPEDHDKNIKRALDVSSTVIGRGSWATSSEEWEYLEAEISEAHENGLIYLGCINLLGLSEFSPEAAEECKNLYDLEGSEAVDINGEIIPHIVSEIGAVENVSSYNLLDPDWQNFLKSQSVKTIDAGADGIYYDDFNFGEYIISKNGEFSELTMERFKNYLENKYTMDQLKQFGIGSIQDFNYADYLLENYDLDSINIEDFLKTKCKESLLPYFNQFLIEETTEFLIDLIEELKMYGKREYNKELKFTGIPSSGFMLAYSYFPFSTLNYVDIPSGHIAYVGEQLLFEQQTKELFFPQKKNIPEYKVVYALTGKPNLTSVSDMTVFLLEEQKQQQRLGQMEYENFIHLAMAEAFASKGQFFDINYPAVAPEIIKKYNDFYLNNREMFIFSSLYSTADVAVIYPATNYRFLETIDFDHRNFYAASLALTDLNIQYDVLVAVDGLECCYNNLDSEDISEYSVMFLPGVAALSDREVDILLSYVKDGGVLILFGEMGLFDEKGERSHRQILENLANGWNYYGAGSIFLSKDPIKDELFYFNYTEDAVLKNTLAGANIGSLIDDRLERQAVSPITESDSITIQVWQDSEKIYIHLLNYGYLWEGDVIKDLENIEIELNPGEKVLEDCVLISPDFKEEQVLKIEDSVITIPRLHIWDIVVLHKE